MYNSDSDVASYTYIVLCSSICYVVIIYDIKLHMVNIYIYNIYLIASVIVHTQTSRPFITHMWPYTH